MSQPLHIGLTRQGLATATDLQRIRQLLGPNQLAIKYINTFLKYGNTLLTQAERLCRSPYDQPRAEVSFGNCVFSISRIQTHREQ